MKNNINIGLYIIMRNVKMQCNDVNKIKKTKKITGSFSLACVVCVHLFPLSTWQQFFLSQSTDFLFIIFC